MTKKQAKEVKKLHAEINKFIKRNNLPACKVDPKKREYFFKCCDRIAEIFKSEFDEKRRSKIEYERGEMWERSLEKLERSYTKI